MPCEQAGEPSSVARALRRPGIFWACARLARSTLWQQPSNDYKALVCVFLFGGNDANNTLIPFDTTGYGQYSSLRGDLALAQNTLLPLTPAPNFALHPSLPDIQTLFNSSNAAFVANVGTLVQPLTRAQYQAGQTAPTNLFSHPDQQLEWQNAAQSAATPTGWAGRMADVLGASYNSGASIPMITSVAGDTLVLQRQFDFAGFRVARQSGRSQLL